MSAEFPSIDRVLPQSGPMRLLDRILEHDGRSTTCVAVPAKSTLFVTAEGDVPAWVGIEYMAQCCAAHGALLLADGRRPPPALLMGARRIDFHADRFDPEGELVVVARPAVGSRKSAAFECSIHSRDGERLLAEARLSFYSPDMHELTGAPRGS
jgi:predicted hotdog family 3-hydroxylacyl-ACP dehydratase